MKSIKKIDDDNDYDPDKPWADYEYKEKKNSIEYKCDGGKCFGDSFPIVKHHLLKRYNSAPGDSWSLTWLK